MLSPDTTIAQAQVEGPSYKDWLVNLGEPTKLTPEQRHECGLEGQPWTCNSGSKSRKKGCRSNAAMEMENRRQRCEQLSRIPPPPVLPATNPSASPGGALAAQDLDGHPVLAGSPLGGTWGPDADAYMTPGDSYLEIPPGIRATRARALAAESWEPASAGPFGLPWWAVILAAGAGLVWVMR